MRQMEGCRVDYNTCGAFNLIYIGLSDLHPMADGYKSVVKQVARATGKGAIWTAAGVAGLWVLAKAGEMEAEEEAKRPPVIAKFDGHDDTFTEPFTTNGPQAAVPVELARRAS
jgi:hypothetical protein